MSDSPVESVDRDNVCVGIPHATSINIEKMKDEAYQKAYNCLYSQALISLQRLLTPENWLERVAYCTNNPTTGLCLKLRGYGQSDMMDRILAKILHPLGYHAVFSAVTSNNKGYDCYTIWISEPKFNRSDIVTAP
jgi:hypothetical protein